jgi:ABC-type nickel/cobalt efflux system permease component RcnA
MHTSSCTLYAYSAIQVHTTATLQPCRAALNVLHTADSCCATALAQSFAYLLSLSLSLALLLYTLALLLTAAVYTDLRRDTMLYECGQAACYRCVI